MKKHNFNAGPSILPEFTIKKTAEKMKDLLEDLLSLSRVGQMKVPDQPLDATRIVPRKHRSPQPAPGGIVDPIL